MEWLHGWRSDPCWRMCRQLTWEWWSLTFWSCLISGLIGMFEHCLDLWFCWLPLNSDSKWHQLELEVSAMVIGSEALEFVALFQTGLCPCKGLLTLVNMLDLLADFEMKDVMFGENAVKTYSLPLMHLDCQTWKVPMHANNKMHGKLHRMCVKLEVKSCSAVHCLGSAENCWARKLKHWRVSVVLLILFRLPSKCSNSPIYLKRELTHNL